MNRQRGLAMIAIYALVALGGLVALAGWWEMHNYQVRKAERQKWEAAVTRCEENVTTAVAANETLKASTEKLMADISAQNQRISDLQQQENAARKAKDATLAQALAQERVLRTEINRLLIVANSTPVVVTLQNCMETLSETEGILRSLTEVRK